MAAPKVKLTEPQARMLVRLWQAKGNYELMPSGNRAAGLASAAWWRTADSLRAKGLVVRIEDGVALTAKGRAALVGPGAHTGR